MFLFEPGREAKKIPFTLEMNQKSNQVIGTTMLPKFSVNPDSLKYLQPDGSDLVFFTYGEIAAPLGGNFIKASRAISDVTFQFKDAVLKGGSTPLKIDLATTTTGNAPATRGVSATQLRVVNSGGDTLEVADGTKESAVFIPNNLATPASDGDIDKDKVIYFRTSGGTLAGANVSFRGILKWSYTQAYVEAKIHCITEQTATIKADGTEVKIEYGTSSPQTEIIVFTGLADNATAQEYAYKTADIIYRSMGKGYHDLDAIRLAVRKLVI